MDGFILTDFSHCRNLENTLLKMLGEKMEAIPPQKKHS